MKIQHLLADNFLRLNLFDVDMSKTTVHLFAGDNEAGKSSVQEAVRFALCGETVRLGRSPKKGDMKLMIRDGAKSGSVAIKLDNVNYVRDIKSGDVTGGGNPAQLPKYLPYLLNAQRFAMEIPGERRAFLIKLTGTDVTPDDIARRLRAKGVHEKCINAVLPNVRSSMDAAHAYALVKRKDAKTEWAGLTGRVYGSQIAAEWKPEPPAGYDPEALLALEPQLENLRAHINSQNVKKGGLVAAIVNAKEKLESQDQPTEKFSQKKLSALEKKITALYAECESAGTEVRKFNSLISNAKNKVPVTCCECGAQITVSFESQPGGGTQAVVKKYRPLTGDELRAMEADMLNASNEESRIKVELKALREEAAAMVELRDAAKGPSATLTQADVDNMEESLRAIESDLAEKGEELQTLTARVVELRTAAELVRTSTQTYDRAQQLHRAVQAWEGCVSWLAPDGIPAEILSDTLKPVNDRLRNTSMITGWPQVAIDPTMEVVCDGRRYSLLSESARWRADVAIADAIAYLSNLKLLVVDRMDVLDIPNRGAFLKWISTIQGDYDTILIFATLKAVPRLPDTMTGHWICNGEIKEV